MPPPIPRRAHLLRLHCTLEVTPTQTRHSQRLDSERVPLAHNQNATKEHSWHATTELHPRLNSYVATLAMTLRIDTRYALKEQADLIRLVQAIRSASGEDETDWLEWKSTLDFTDRAHRFAIAKAIIGMANRMPEIAERNCQGLSYIVIGVAPGVIRGVKRIDPAQLLDALLPYLGTDGPRWSHNYVQLENQDVLIIIVDPPNLGDKIHSLRKSFTPAYEGAIFVRRTGKTEPATPQDLTHLQERFARSRLDISLDIASSEALLWMDQQRKNEIVDRLACEHRDKLLSAVRIYEHRGESTPRHTAANHLLGSIGVTQESVMRMLEHRSPDEYREQINSWYTDWLAAARDEFIRWCIDNYPVVLQLRVSNLTRHNYRDLRIEVILPQSTAGCCDDLRDSVLPSVPAAFGRGTIANLLAPLPVAYPPGYLGIEYPETATWAEALDDGIRLVWDVGDIRPYETCEASDFYCIFHSGTPVPSLEPRWQSTATNIDGVCQGTVVLELSRDPIDLTAFEEQLRLQLVETRKTSETT